MVATVSPARVVAQTFSAFVTPQTKLTTARTARPVVDSSPTALSRAFCATTGQRLLKNSVSFFFAYEF